MTFVTLKRRSKSWGSNLVWAPPAAFVHQISWGFVRYFLKYWAATTFHVIALNDLCDLENEVKVTHLNFVFILHWCCCVPKLLRIRQLFLQDIEWKLAYVVDLNDLCDTENEIKVTQFKLGLCLALILLCTIFGEDKSNISSDIEWKQSFICCRLEWRLWTKKWGQGYRFKIGLCLALVLLCTKFGEDTLDISSDIERKQSFICSHLKWPL